jgi:heptosyltransferase-1
VTIRNVSTAAGRILIVRLGAMGDVLHALAAAARVRDALPSADIGWAIEERWAELLCARGEPRTGPRSPQRPLVDAIHAVDTRAWRAALFSAQTWRGLRAVRRELRAARYDLVLDLQGAMKSAVLARLSGAPRRFGFARPRERAAALFYTHRIGVMTEGRHIIEQDIELTERALGMSMGMDRAAAAQGSLRFELPRDPAAEAWCAAELRARSLVPFAILNPGAGWGAKLWPAAKYAEVARALAGDGVRSVVNHGPGEEALAAQVVSASAGAAEALPCSPAQLIALTRHASLFVGGDTGPMHLAAALGVPVVALFGPTDPARNGPFATRSVVLRSPQSVTSYSHRAASDTGLQSIAADHVINAARRLLGGRE